MKLGKRIFVPVKQKTGKITLHERICLCDQYRKIQKINFERIFVTKTETECK